MLMGVAELFQTDIILLFLSNLNGREELGKAP